METKAAPLNMGFLLQAVKYWLATAVILTLILSCVIYFGGLSGEYVGYASSLISFAACLSAGAAAQRRRGGGALYTGLIIALTAILTLLTIGFVIDGINLESSGVLSVASFSAVGSCSGSVLIGGRGSGKKPFKRRKIGNFKK